MAGIDYLIERHVIDALEEAEMLANQGGRVHHPFLDPLEEYSDNQFKKLYRLTKPVTLQLIELLEPHLTAPSRVSGLSITRKVSTNINSAPTH